MLVIGSPFSGLLVDRLISWMPSHVWLFDGAEGGQWVQDIEREREAAQRVEDSKTSPIPLSPGGSANGSVRREPKKLRVG